MLLYCRNNQVIATHDDARSVPPWAYGDGIQVLPVPDGMPLTRSGPPPLTGRRGDLRPYAMPAPTPSLMGAYAAYKVKLVAAAPITVGGIPVAVDDATVTKLSQLKQRFDSGTVAVATFKGADGSFHSLNAGGLSAVLGAVTDRLNALEAAEAQIAAGVADGSIATYSDIDRRFAAIG